MPGRLPSSASPARSGHNGPMPKIDGAAVAAALADRDQLVAFAAMVLSCDPAVAEARMGYDAHGGGISYITATGAAKATGLPIATATRACSGWSPPAWPDATARAMPGDRTSQPWTRSRCRRRPTLDLSPTGDSGLARRSAGRHPRTSRSGPGRGVAGSAGSRLDDLPQFR